MIVESKVNHVERSQQFEENSFSIKASSEIFKILRDSLYSDPILAILREYSANCSDSHIISNQRDRPIEIQLPSIFDPVLKIRDFGYGLSHEDMFQVFCVYGESTKKSSNEMVGFFGVGAKVGFAYSASFQITSIHKGIKSIYNAYLDESECGKLALLVQSETTEEQGIEISINVNQNDINTFITTAQNLFKFWTPYPIFTGNIAFKETKVNYFLVRDNEWGFMNVADSYQRGSGIVMGNIFYKVEAVKIPDLTDLQMKILDKNLVIFANIGDVVLQASRESVNYSPITIKFIKNKLKTIEDEIRAEADKKQAGLTSEYEARKLYFDLFNTAGQFGVLAELFKSHIEVKWDGKTITTPNFPVETFEGFVAEYYEDRQRKSRVHVNEVKHSGWEIIQNEGKPETRLFFDVKGMGKGKIRKMIRHYAEENLLSEGDDIFIVQVSSPEQLVQICLARGIDSSVFLDIHEAIKLPIVPRAPKTASTYSNCKVFDPNGEFDGEVIEHGENGFIKVNVDLKEDSGYFLIRNYSDYFFKGGKPAGDNIRRIWNALMQFDPEFKDNPVIYTFSQAKSNKITNNWRVIDESLKLFIPVWEAQNQTTRINHNSLSGAAPYFATFLELIRKDVKFDEYEAVRTSIDFKNTSRLHDTNMTRRLIGLEEITDATYEKTRGATQKALDELYASIPLLQFIGYYDLDKKFGKFFVEYIKEKRNKNNQNTLDQELVTA